MDVFYAIVSTLVSIFAMMAIGKLFDISKSLKLLVQFATPTSPSSQDLIRVKYEQEKKEKREKMATHIAVAFGLIVAVVLVIVYKVAH